MDQDIADAIIKAVEDLNAALAAGEAAGLNVAIFFDDKGRVELERVEKVTVVRFEKSAR